MDDELSYIKGLNLKQHSGRKFVLNDQKIIYIKRLSQGHARAPNIELIQPR
jgi:hypothetical protein